MIKNTLDGIPLWLLARPEHINNLLDAPHPFVLINKYEHGESSPLAPTHELSRLAFAPGIIRDFCNFDTMAVPLKKCHRNLSNLIVLGRAENCDIIVTRDEISRKHCGFYKVDNNWFVIDLESTNGIGVNGSLAPKAKLNSQSIVSLGQINIAFITATDLGFLVVEINAFEQV